MKKLLFAAMTAVLTMNAVCADAQTKESPMGTIFVNEHVTTHLIMPETIRLVDISTDTIAGNQVNDNIVRLKPTGAMNDHEQAGVVTVIGERHIAQYRLVYRDCMLLADTRYTIPGWGLQEYTNPDVQMSMGEMSRYAFRMFNAKRTVTNIHSKKDKMKAWVNHICSAGDYFFIDFSMEATNYQSIELTPEYMLYRVNHFKKHYRNVIVIKKLTFPEAKVLKIEVSENQISGRTIELNIKYDDVLNADCFDD